LYGNPKIQLAILWNKLFSKENFIGQKAFSTQNLEIFSSEKFLLQDLMKEISEKYIDKIKIRLLIKKEREECCYYDTRIKVK